MRTLAALLMLLSTLAWCGENEEYAQALKELGLKPPIDVTFADIFTDGGTLCATLTGAENTKIDISVGHHGESLGQFVTGALHREFDGAKVVERGSARETAIIFVLRRWLNDNYTVKQQEKFFQRTGVNGLTKDEVKALRVAHMIGTAEIGIKRINVYVLLGVIIVVGVAVYVRRRTLGHR
ncbi:MAG TPA: hypothetical protein VEK08_24160 [Planctomycetota bacterium]|nr:hypothetical protein [Planctomycetota bacterium]